MTVYAIIVMNKLTKSEYLDALYEDEASAEEEAEILQGELLEGFKVFVEEHTVKPKEKEYHA